jgi:hypothetical protein
MANGRCRMHGGRSTGPRTADGIARLRTARTAHGGYSAAERAWNRNTIALCRRGRVWREAVRYQAALPQHFVERLHTTPFELMALPAPVKGISRARDRAIIRAEAEALAPWQAAIAAARAARGPAAQPEAHAPAPNVAAAAEAHAPAPETAAVMAEGQAFDPQIVEAAIAQPPARAHAPAQQPSAASWAEPHVRHQQPASPAGSAVQRPHAPDRAPPTHRLTLRQHLLAGTRHGTIAMQVERVGGWPAIISFAATL